MWTFTPKEGATVMVPDQDWLAFGVWLTAPDDTPVGMHRVGVVHSGRQAYAYSTATGLVGSATYKGNAAGYYINRGDSGVFTADVNLNADFDADMLSGSVNNFRNSRGGFVDSDTIQNPNDPNQGGEGDWVVQLGITQIGTEGAVDGAEDSVSGSADGVLWESGEWNAQLYGPGHRVADTAEPPTGVTGNFRAVTRNIGTEEAPAYKGVVGGFGATLGTHTTPPP